jgi:hypothetical protein
VRATSAAALLLALAFGANAHDAWLEPQLTGGSAELRLMLGENFKAQEMLPFEGMVAVAREPFYVDLDAERFNRYLAEEGHADALRTAEPVRERVTRHLKTFVGTPDSAFTRRFGMRLEIVPTTLPVRGEPFAVRVLLDGRPLANARVSFLGAATTVARTDRNGEAKAVIGEGLVLVRTTHIERCRNGGAAYASDWAALTFTAP